MIIKEETFPDWPEPNVVRKIKDILSENEVSDIFVPPYKVVITKLIKQDDGNWFIVRANVTGQIVQDGKSHADLSKASVPKKVSDILKDSEVVISKQIEQSNDKYTIVEAKII